MTVPYRPFQAKLDQDIDDFHAAGARNVVAVAPTGAGKSVLVSNRSERHDGFGWLQAIIAHRQELVGQMAMHVARAGVEHRILGDRALVNEIIEQQRDEFGRSFVNPSARCTVAGVDTLNARFDSLVEWGAQVSRWTIDEGHHCLALNKWGKSTKLFPNAFGLMVTATPQRADGIGLGRHAGGIADAMVIGPTMGELIDQGYLCKPEFATPDTDFDLENLVIGESGEITAKSAKEASRKSHIVGDVVDWYFKLAFMKRTIVFAIDVEDANAIATRFNLMGVPAASVNAKTPGHVRREYIKQFRSGKLWVLVNVDLFGEGFDVPAVECVIMARPTASLAVYLQQVGRALRPAPGKVYGLIIDLVSNLKRHGPPQLDRYWTLDSRDKRVKRPADPDDMPERSCIECTRPYPRVYRCCPFCGHVPVPMAGGRTLEQVDGDLMMLSYDDLEKLRKSAQLESPASIALRVGEAAGHMAGAHAATTQIERIQEQEALKETIAWWAAHERAKGRPDEQSYRRFYIMLGVDVITAQSLPCAQMADIRAKVRSWYDA